MYLNTLSQSKSIDGSALVSVVNYDGHENTETHTAGPTECTSVNGRVGGVQTGSSNIPEHVYEEQSLLMHESQYNKNTHEDVPGIAEEKGRLPKNSPVIQPFINQSECAQVISSALMSNQRLQDFGDIPSCGKGHQLVSQHSPYTPKENCNNEHVGEGSTSALVSEMTGPNEIEGDRNESLSIKHRSSIAVREDNCTRVSKCQRQSEKLQQRVGKGIEQNNSIESLQQASTLIADSMKPSSTQNLAVPTTAHMYESANGMEGFQQSSSSIEGGENHGKREDGIVFPINEQRFQQSNGMPDFQQALL